MFVNLETLQTEDAKNCGNCFFSVRVEPIVLQNY